MHGHQSLASSNALQLACETSMSGGGGVVTQRTHLERLAERAHC